MLKPKSQQILLLIAFLILAISTCSQAVDVSRIFEKETHWLADNVAKETKSEYMYRTTDGMVQFADIKPKRVGDIVTFNAFNVRENRHNKVNATLKKIGKHCYLYVQEGKKIGGDIITKIVGEFDSKIYSNARSMFGSEWKPGIDDDSKITLFLLDIQDDYNPDIGRKEYVGGFFYAGDCYNKSKNPRSNEREMLYLDIYPSKPGSKMFMSTVAHEFQHMIHWNNDPKEFIWVNESLSQYAQFLCGYGHPSQLNAFVRNPNNNLAAWSDDDMIANYGQTYLWAYYISSKIASTSDRRREFMRRMVSQKSQGFSGINAAIKKQGIKNNVRNLFKNFCLANYLNDDSIADGVYGYDKHLARLALPYDYQYNKISAEGSGNIKIWSSRAAFVKTDAIKGKRLKISFSGQKLVAGNYSNSFDVAVVTYPSGRSTPPSVRWMNIRLNKANMTLEVPKTHNRLLMVFVNRGPEVMKIEQAFAQGAPPAAFSYSIRPFSSTKTSRVASNRVSSPRASRATSQSIIEEIASVPDIRESSQDMVNASKNQDNSVAHVEFDFAYQKVAEKEAIIVDSIRSELETGNLEILSEFTFFYSSANDLQKERLSTLRNRVRDILKFEQLQGNSKVAEHLSELD